MSASFPFALAALVLAVPLVAAYLHRRRRVEKRVPSLLLLRVIAGTSRPTRRAWSRPRHLVSLVLVLLALVGLVLALVDLHDDHLWTRGLSKKQVLAEIVDDIAVPRRREG